MAAYVQTNIKCDVVGCSAGIRDDVLTVHANTVELRQRMKKIGWRRITLKTFSSEISLSTGKPYVYVSHHDICPKHTQDSFRTIKVKGRWHTVEAIEESEEK